MQDALGLAVRTSVANRAHDTIGTTTYIYIYHPDITDIHSADMLKLLSWPSKDKDRHLDHFRAALKTLEVLAAESPSSSFGAGRCGLGMAHAVLTLGAEVSPKTMDLA